MPLVALCVVEPTSPPENPEEWSDEQWLEWLVATDALPPSAPGDDEPAPATRIARVVHSSAGRLIGEAMRGAHKAIYGRDDDVVIVIEAQGEPHGDDPYDVIYDPEHPEQAVVVVRDRPGRHDDGPTTG